MLLSCLRIALRHLTRNRSTTFINIAGLAIGMATALLTGLWIAMKPRSTITLPTING